MDRKTFFSGLFGGLVVLLPVLLMGAVPNISDRTEPSVAQRAVTASDSVNFTDGACRSLWIAVGGDVAVVGLDGAATTIEDVPSGTVLPVAAKRVNSTGTTATGIVALYGVLCLETLRKRLRALLGIFGKGGVV